MPLNMSWMRQNTVNILKYLPDFPANDEDFLAVATACNEEHDRIRLELQDVFEQFFVTTATWGLSYWEDVLDITAKPADDYDRRRTRILLKLQSNQTSTVAFMKELAAKYYASNATIQVKEDNANYAFRIIVDAVAYDPDGLYEAIQMYKPAHLAAIIVHLLTASANLFMGAVIQCSRETIINPDLGFSATVNSSKIYAGGIVMSYGLTKIT